MMLEYVSPSSGKKLKRNGSFYESYSGEKFEIVKDIPRFVPADNYASAFGLQWKNFAATQLDSKQNISLSLERLERCFGFKLNQLEGKAVLEAGCGAGRFTEWLVKNNALVHAIDLSVAVEANKENIGEQLNYKVAQASIYEIPYPDNSFDFVMCLGVIQHTPSPEKTIAALFKKVKPGGMLVIDHYKWRLAYYGNMRFIYRKILKRMKPEASLKIVSTLTKIFFPLHWALKGNKVLYWILIRFTPLLEYTREFPQLTKEQHYEWCRLDTYDSLTDYYKHLRTPSQIKNTLTQLGAKQIEVWLGGNGVEARCVK